MVTQRSLKKKYNVMWIIKSKLKVEGNKLVIIGLKLFFTVIMAPVLF